MLDLLKVLPQVDQMAEQAARQASSGAATLPTEEIYRILASQREADLEAYQAKYNVQFTRETFTLDAPSADGTFVLEPDGDDPLPPVGCKVKVYGSHGETWLTTVIDTNEEAGTYTATITERAP